MQRAVRAAVPVCGVVRPRLHCGCQLEISIPSTAIHVCGVVRPRLHCGRSPAVPWGPRDGLRGRKAPPPLRLPRPRRRTRTRHSLRGRKAPPPLRLTLYVIYSSSAKVCGVVRPRLHCGQPSAAPNIPPATVCGVVRPRLHCGHSSPGPLMAIPRVCGVVRPRLHCGLVHLSTLVALGGVCGVVRPRLHCGDKAYYVDITEVPVCG